MRLLIATSNPGKVREFREMLGADAFRWSDLSMHKLVQAIEESGQTFRANACLKASHYARQFKPWSLADDAGRIILTAQDSVEGKILHEPRGVNGFGYDPLFLVPELGKTTAELLPAEKHAVSHRGKALRRLKSLMEQVELI